MELEGYSHIEKIASSGNAVVYRAVHHESGLPVAIKAFNNTEPQAEALFRRGYEALSHLSQHPNIVEVIDYVQADDGTACLILELLGGHSLGELVKTAPNGIPEVDAVWITGKVLNGLAAAHAGGLLHHGLKPANVLFGNGDVKLADFGVAKLMDEQASVSAMLTTTVIHAAPEVLMGEDATAASDIFSVGAMLYGMLVGHSLHATVPKALAWAAKGEPPLPLDDVEASPQTRKWLHQALAHNSDDRFTTAQQALDEFGDVSQLEPSDVLQRRLQTEPTRPSAHGLGFAQAPGADNKTKEMRAIDPDQPMGVDGAGPDSGTRDRRDRRDRPVSAVGSMSDSDGFAAPGGSGGDLDFPPPRFSAAGPAATGRAAPGGVSGAVPGSVFPHWDEPTERHDIAEPIDAAAHQPAGFSGTRHRPVSGPISGLQSGADPIDGGGSSYDPTAIIDPNQSPSFRSAGGARAAAPTDPTSVYHGASTSGDVDPVPVPISRAKPTYLEDDDYYDGGGDRLRLILVLAIGLGLLAGVGFAIWRVGATVAGEEAGDENVAAEPEVDSFPIPSVVNTEEEQAKARLRELGLVVTVELEHSDAVRKGFVVAQSMTEGETAVSGDVVVLTISQGPSEVPAPALIGLDEQQVMQTLTSAGLTWRFESQEVPFGSADSGKVLGQVPGPNVEVTPGSEIVVTLGEAPRACETRSEPAALADVSFNPPHTRGDRDFARNGPRVDLDVQLTARVNQLDARVFMKAEETRRDFTTAEGSTDVVLYTAPDGWQLRSVEAPDRFQHRYVDRNENPDTFTFDQGLVRQVTFQGAGPGPDAGVTTGVTVSFHQVTVNLAELGDCILLDENGNPIE